MLLVAAGLLAASTYAAGDQDRQAVRTTSLAGEIRYGAPSSECSSISNSAHRSSMTSSVSCISITASGRPTQKCRPFPQLSGGRARSRRSRNCRVSVGNELREDLQ
jgi:hypothetical protein